MEKRPFDGLKVLDFTWGGVGPFQSNFLAYYGATVVRVESGARPDITRTGGNINPRLAKDGGIDKIDKRTLLEYGPTFAVTHPTHKMGMSLNLKHPEGVDIFKKLVAWADVLVESFVTGMLEKYGLGYEDLKKVNPRLIMHRTCGYGHSGPMAAMPGYGQTVTSFTGFYTITGWPDGKSVPISSFYTDHLSPLFGGLALITAIDHQQRTGEGQCIDQAQIETGINYLSPIVLDYTFNRRELALRGNKSDIAAPHGAYRCKGEERWVAITVQTDQEWDAFCEVVGDPEWTMDERFATLSGRIYNSDDLDKYINEWTANYTSEQVMAMMQDAGVAAGVVATAQDSEADPQLKEYDFFREIDHKYLGPQKFFHPPGFTLSDAVAEVHRPVYLGEHTEQICREFLGMSDEEYARLDGEGAFE
ncbi:MAG: CoA transferase [Dehalococcoidales bacterium]|nr:CoA transferase [Dehalococcoidales bacterium]